VNVEIVAEGHAYFEYHMPDAMTVEFGHRTVGSSGCSVARRMRQSSS
jgi:hypothetical protein